MIDRTYKTERLLYIIHSDHDPVECCSTVNSFLLFYLMRTHSVYLNMHLLNWAGNVFIDVIWVMSRGGLNGATPHCNATKYIPDSIGAFYIKLYRKTQAQTLGVNRPLDWICGILL